jgi:RecB family exonuclease
MAFPKEYISHNQIRTYLECPYKYYLSYIKELSAPCNEKVYLGNIFHAAIEQFFLRRLDNSEMPLEELRQLFCDKFAQEQKQEEINWTESVSETEKRGLAFISYFHHNIAPEIRPLMIEKELEVSLPGTEVRLKGIIDLVEEDFTIIDFKTSTSRWSESRARGSLQFLIYKYLFDVSFRASSPRIRIEQLYNGVHKSTKHHSIVFAVTPAQIEALLERIRTIIGLIEGGNFAPTGSFSCKWCDFRQQCQSGCTSRT